MTRTPASLHPALFLDRDGVINENLVHYVTRWDQIVFIPGVLAALARVAAAPYRIVIITNQPAVGHGLISLEGAQEINRRVVGSIEAAGGRIDAVYMCPHLADDGCACRKPAPGMLLQAAADHSLDLAASVFIGDAASDIQAGRAAGVGLNLLVRTGRGAAQEPLLAADPPPVYQDLVQALAAAIPADRPSG